MVDPGDIGQAFGDFFNADVMSQLLTYLGYIVFSALLLAGLVVIYFAVQYKFKVIYPILHYSDDKQSAQIIGYKTDRARSVISEGVRKQHLLKKKQTIEPFREEDIQPGNKVIIFKINEDGTYISMPSLKFSGPISKFEQLNPEEKYWAVLQLKENAKTFQNDDATRRAMMLTIFTVIFCLVVAGLTVYLSLQAPNQIVSSFDSWGQQFVQVAQNIGGTPPN